MELHNQIRKYRTNMCISQEELAEKIYVTRQTISNWENNKNYPDIHSLLLLSTLFNVSLDQLIKGDTETMKSEIDKSSLKKFNRDSTIFTILLLLSIVLWIPLTVFFKIYGLVVSLVIWGVALYFSLKIEKYKKRNDIQTFKEIMAFMDGKSLDEIDKAVEKGKRPYQKVVVIIGAVILTLIISAIGICMLNSFVF